MLDGGESPSSAFDILWRYFGDGEKMDYLVAATAKLTE